MRHLRLILAVSVSVTVCLNGSVAANARVMTVVSGPLRAVAQLDPWQLRFEQGGRMVLDELADSGRGPAGTLGFGSNPVATMGGSPLTPAGVLWWHATRALSATTQGSSVVARLATNDPLGRQLIVTIAPAGAGVIAVHATFMPGAGPGTTGVTQVADGFASAAGEHFSGFGGRENAVDQAGGTVETWSEEGAWIPADRPVALPFIEPWTFSAREDGSYFPMPWLVSSRGYGFLLDDSQLSRFRLRSDRPDAWSVEADTGHLDYRVFAGPTPLDVVRRFSAVIGRQPPPVAPWELGPWWDPFGPDQASLPAELRREDVPGSEIQTYRHYLPCAAQAGHTAAERAMVSRIHALGYAVTTYFNPHICLTYPSVYQQAETEGAFVDNALGRPYVITYTGNTVSELDFSTQVAGNMYARLLGEAIATGYDGWMEDYGEYTPPDAVAHDGSPGSALHNLYPRLYHCAAHHIAASQGRPIVEYDRSGYVGSAPCQPVVWSGDPTTDWSFDGLPGMVSMGINYGYSGIGIYGSDIGGYMSITAPPTTPELLIRWLEFGAFSGVMRTMAEGLDLHSQPVAQIWDPSVLPTWRRYAKLRTELYPYIANAISAYERSGVPPMEALGLAYPNDATSWSGPPRYLFGTDLLVEPVVAPGVRKSTVPLPPGRWLSFWRAVTYSPHDGSFHLRAAPVLTGPRTVTVPAPLEQIPLFVRNGTLLALLPADVATLAAYGTGLVHLKDRAGQLHLLAWPRGLSSTLALGTKLRSGLGPREWSLTVSGRAAAIEIEAVLTWKPTGVTWRGRRLARAVWSYEAGVLHAHVHGLGVLRVS